MSLPHFFVGLVGPVGLYGKSQSALLIYPLVMTNIAMENHYFNGKIHYFYGDSMVIFNSYVKLPEGKLNTYPTLKKMLRA